MLSKHMPKFTLMLSGVMSRLSDELDIFEEIKCDYMSGSKTFPMKITFCNNNFICSFLGTDKVIDISEISSIVVSEANKYDALNFEFITRAGGMTISVDSKGVSMKNLERKTETVQKTAVVSGRNYIIKESDAPELLKAVGVMAENGKIKNDMIRKYNQIDRFLELISDLELGDGNLTIMDCACGKSYLSFVLNYYFTEIRKRKCMIYGIDYKESVVEASEKIRKQLNYNNMKFINADLKEFNLDKKVDMVVSLHACDVATDYALYSGIIHNSKAIVSIPCCHKELANDIEYEPFNSVFRHGIFQRRFCDILTDSLRCLLLEACGYKVSVIEYTSPLDTPKNIMLKAVKTSGFNQKAYNEYKKLAEQFKVSPTLNNLLLPVFCEKGIEI